MHMDFEYAHPMSLILCFSVTPLSVTYTESLVKSLLSLSSSLYPPGWPARAELLHHNWSVQSKYAALQSQLIAVIFQLPLFPPSASSCVSVWVDLREGVAAWDNLATVFRGRGSLGDETIHPQRLSRSSSISDKKCPTLMYLQWILSLTYSPERGGLGGRACVGARPG